MRSNIPNFVLWIKKTDIKVFFRILFCRQVVLLTHPPQTRHPDWSGSISVRTSLCQTPPLSASHGGCFSSGTSWWGTSDTWKTGASLFTNLTQTGSNDAYVEFKCSELISPFRKLFLRRDVDLVLHAADMNNVAQIPRFTVDLDPLFEEGFLLER